MSLFLGGRRNCKTYEGREVTWPDFLEIFNDHRIATKETHKEFMSFNRDRQAEIKDIGGYVFGKLKKGSRKQVINRDAIVFDADNIDRDIIDRWNLGYSDITALIHSTHKHTQAHPRLRFIIPLSRSVDTVEYQAAARKLAQHLGIEQFDQTTYDPGRMMFWQSTPCDIEPVYIEYKGEFLDVDALLGEYTDFHDISQWPRADREDNDIHERADKKENPLTKGGIIGQFCKCYDIHEAIATFIPDYERCGENRYTYLKGTTTGGVITFENLFSYSYHDHDPACGIECNAFDLVRLHKFGDLDKGKKNPNVTKLESYKAMVKFAEADERVIALNEQERLADFEDVSEQMDDKGKEDFNRQIKETERLLKGKRRDGTYPLSVHNINAMFENHPMLKGILAWDEFRQRIVLKHAIWRNISPTDNAIKDCDDAEIRRVFEKYGMLGKDRIYDATVIEARKNNFHPVKQYLEGLTWDGTERIETALVDYFGSIANRYNCYISKLFFMAAVMRVYVPGCQFDTMLTIKGPQGCGKSTFFRVLGGDWFSDAIKDLKSKDTVEGLQGIWIHEFSELSAMKRADAEMIKSFLSTTKDRFRAPYGRRTEDYPRQCVFGATTNEVGFLYDKTGNRRFLIFEIQKNAKPKKDVFTDLKEERDQLWAEAYAMVKKDKFKTNLALPPDIEKMAYQIQRGFMQDDPLADAIEAYLKIPLPDDWDQWETTDRRKYIQTALKEENAEAQTQYKKLREYVCTNEIWEEVMVHSDSVSLPRQEALNINRILDNLPDWERIKNEAGEPKTHRFAKYGTQKGFRRVTLGKKENKESHT